MSGISKKLLFVGCVFAASVLFVSLAICEEQQEAAKSEESPQEQATEWIWGEVSSVDNQNNQIKLKYTDEESLEEKEITIGVDSETTYEDAQSLLDIKPTDNISVDYVVTTEGANLAKKIAVEKAQETGLSLPEADLNNTQATYP